MKTNTNNIKNFYKYPTMEEIKKTPTEWSILYGFGIVDNDGWRDGTDFTTPLTFEEFVQRADQSTIEIVNKSQYRKFMEDVNSLPRMKTKEPATKTSPAPELVKYLRDENRNPRGVVLAKVVQIEGKEFIGIGWSRCSVKDSFNKEKGLLIARGRAATGTNVEMKPELVPIYEEMKERAVKYFGKKIGPWF